MKHFRMWIGCSVAAALLAGGAMAGDCFDKFTRDFAHPPDAARPWVYWMWMDGNMSREGITADLKVMQRAGIGGVIIMEVDRA